MMEDGAQVWDALLRVCQQCSSAGQPLLVVLCALSCQISSSVLLVFVIDLHKLLRNIHVFQGAKKAEKCIFCKTSVVSKCNSASIASVADLWLMLLMLHDKCVAGVCCKHKGSK